MIPLGDAIQRLQFSESEWSRIAALVIAGKLPAKILAKHAPQTEGFRRSAPRMKIAGHSVGRPGHTAKAVELIGSHLNGSDDPLKQKTSRRIYFEAVVHYVRSTLPKLNRLMLEVKVEEKTLTTMELFSLLATNVHQFDVTPKELEELYEFWGFERDDGVESVISKCSEASTDAKQDKRINALENRVQADESRSEELAQLVHGLEATQTKAITESRATSDRLTDDLKAVTTSLSRVEQRLTTIERRINNVEGGSAELRKSIDSEVRGIKTELESLRRQAAGIPLSVSKEVSAFKEDIAQTLRTENETARSEFLQRINQRAEQILSQHVQSQTIQDVKKFVSPLRAAPSKFQPSSYKITDENQLINLWKGRLFSSGVSLCFESVAIFHSLVSANNCFVVDDERIPVSWLKTLGWESSRFDIVASPAWLSEEDWRDGSEFLFKKEEISIPKSLFIHNYDAGVVQAYLVPTLKLWELSQKRFPLSKIFLIPSTTQESGPPADVLEYAIDLPEDELSASRNSLPSSSKIREISQSQRDANHTGVKPEDYLRWLVVDRSDQELRNEMSELVKWSGIELPLSVGLRFSRSQQFLAKFFGEEDSKQIAAYHCICPWIRAKLGDDKSDEFYGLLKSFFSKALNY